MASLLKEPTILQKIDARLQELLTWKNIQQQTLLDASRHSMFAGGKRLRAQMCLIIANTHSQDALDIACALECIHTYSLIHDDLPCMDDAKMRRGKPALHIAFSEADALLTGSFLLTYAISLITKTHLPSTSKVQIIDTITKNIGSMGLIGGQVLDISESLNETLSWQMYQKIAKEKTANLFVATALCGGILKKASDNELQVYQEFGELFGLLYQIQDDLKDHTDEGLSILQVFSVKEALLQKEQLFTKIQTLTKSYPHLQNLLIYLQ